MQIQAGPHSILGIIKFSDLKFTHIKETGEVLDYKELIFKYIKVYILLYILHIIGPSIIQCYVTCKTYQNRFNKSQRNKE